MTEQAQQVQTVTETVTKTKELTEVFDLLAKIAKDIKAKKSIAEMATEDFPALYKAIDGFQSLPAEVKSEHSDMTIAVGFAKISKELRA